MIKTDPAKALLTLADAVLWRQELKKQGKRLVVTNGCFDILHHGHARYLYESRLLGDALLILLNSDASVRRIKGPTRPVNGETSRAYLLASLAAVDRVVIFDNATCAAELAALAPDIYVKGGDYTCETMNRQERTALENAGAEICFKPFLPGFSTTSIIEKCVGGAGADHP